AAQKIVVAVAFFYRSLHGKCDNSRSRRITCVVGVVAEHIDTPRAAFGVDECCLGGNWCVAIPCNEYSATATVKCRMKKFAIGLLRFFEIRSPTAMVEQ